MARSSIKEVAALAGVSTATVSRCINTAEKVSARTRAKVASAIKTLDYTPNTLAQQFRRGRTQMVMVVVPAIGDPFFTEVMAGIRQVASARAYSVVINEAQVGSMPPNELSALRVSRRTDGIIVLASLPPFGTQVRSAQSQQLLPIVVGCEAIAPALTEFPGVHIDNIAAARQATEYLLAQGHRRIGMIGGPTQAMLTKDRESGFRAAMSKANIEVSEQWIQNGPLSIAGAIAATRNLARLPQPPTAIFCLTDELALGCLHCLRVLGKTVPSDFSVMGFDDTRYAAIADPPLTTIRQPCFRIGERVMTRLLQEIESNGQSQQPQPRQEVIEHELVIRQSVAEPKH